MVCSLFLLQRQGRRGSTRGAAKTAGRWGGPEVMYLSRGTPRPGPSLFGPCNRMAVCSGINLATAHPRLEDCHRETRKSPAPLSSPAMLAGRRRRPPGPSSRFRLPASQFESPSANCRRRC
ncbi:hypothetical protein PVAP13_3NG124600 [Panicum virgatum]|uniref:Uncharacterized protein n=1 Tax=Panicum virgatum TaxID=38727 RepID=A0A8T0UGL4_PANVG|nr:hypothetical protein PVAP13_3NG124600 [Panicum virgatum]